MRMDWLHILFSLCHQHSLLSFHTRATADCQKREQCLREVTAQIALECMFWVTLLIDHFVEVKASRYLPYNMPMLHTDDPLCCNCWLHKKTFVWPRSTQHRTKNQRVLGQLLHCCPIAPRGCRGWVCSLVLGNASMSACCFISPCQQGFKLASFPCQHSPVASLRPMQIKHLAFVFCLIATAWPPLLHTCPSSPKQQPGDFHYFSQEKFQYNQNTIHNSLL